LVFVARTREEWLKRLEENDVPAGPLYNMAEVLADPQVTHLNLVEGVKHPKVGALKFVRSSVNYTGLHRAKGKPPPLLGEQTQTILTELGYSQAAVEELARQGVVKVAQG
jgi:crotonobetainyl-CoA:carnitine CoA-transferase CaiB-like acyl-CoA transferase